MVAPSRATHHPLHLTAILRHGTARFHHKKTTFRALARCDVKPGKLSRLPSVSQLTKNEPPRIFFGPALWLRPLLVLDALLFFRRQLFLFGGFRLRGCLGLFRGLGAFGGQPCLLFRCLARLLDRLEPGRFGPVDGLTWVADRDVVALHDRDVVLGGLAALERVLLGSATRFVTVREAGERLRRSA